VIGAQKQNRIRDFQILEDFAGGTAGVNITGMGKYQRFGLVGSLRRSEVFLAKLPEFARVGRVKGAGHMRSADQHQADPVKGLKPAFFRRALFAAPFLAGLLVMLAGLQDLQDAFPLDLFLEPLNGFLKRFVLSYIDLRHAFAYLSLWGWKSWGNGQLLYAFP
jgi:hypothetical protein